MNFSDLLNNQEFINFINELFDKGLSISIQDEVAWKSIGATGFITAIFTGIVTFFTTYIANKFATKSTLELFDKQEKIKINLDQILKDRNKTAYWLSKETGLSQQNIGLLKNGKTKSIRFESIVKICTALNCEVGDLFEVIKD